MHRDQRLDAPVADGHLPILDLLREPRLAAAIRCLAGAEAHAMSYTQVARRTPAPRKARRDLPDTSYHIDGEANASGARLTDPDVFSLLVAVALTPHERPGMGNLTVFPRGHLRDWRQYPDWKRDKGARTSGCALRGQRSASATRFCAIISYRTAAAAITHRRTARVLPGATGGRTLAAAPSRAPPRSPPGPVSETPCRRRRATFCVSLRQSPRDFGNATRTSFIVPDGV